MHSLLETYLEEIAERLGPLPVARRNEEIKEMRQHLLNAIIVNRELGQPEDEAAQTAVEQFGVPTDLGDSLVWAWRRDQKIDRWCLWGAASCVLVLLSLLTRLEATPLVTPFLNVFGFYGLYVQAWLAVDFIIPVSAGVIVGLITPRHAVTGAAIGAALWLVVQIVLMSVMFRPISVPALWGGRWAVAIVLTALGSWAGSRWRERRARLARN